MAQGDFDLFSALASGRGGVSGDRDKRGESPGASGASPTGSEEKTERELKSSVPLATRMRPQSLDTYVGQTHIIGPGTLLRRAIEADRVQSCILYGPPGTGKTTLARIIAAHTRSRFERVNAVEGTVADLRRILGGAMHRRANTGQSTLLFIDELHRFNKSQQDVLLPEVEAGSVKLIGATTHNPFFFVNAPLVSRSQVFELKPLDEADLLVLLRRALQDTDNGLGGYRVQAEEAALRHWARICDGDARRCLNALEIAVLTTPPNVEGIIPLTLQVAEQCIQKKAVVYDGDGDAHYDTISAFIKSIRGSDPDAALYWLAKMIHAGEDPRFITRRILIHAAEDIGLADPMALVLASAAHEAVQVVGWPEARIPIAEAVIYLAAAPKSNSVVLAINAAMEDVAKGRTLEVPVHLRDGHYPGSKRLGHGEGYRYSHDYAGHFVPQDYLGAPKRFYAPTEQGSEKKLKDRLDQWRALAAEALAANDRVSNPAKEDSSDPPPGDPKSTRGTREALMEAARDGRSRDSITVASEKARLRREMRAFLKTVSAEQRRTVSQQVTARLRTLDIWEASSWLVYWAIGSEIETEALIQELLDRNSTVCLPAMDPVTGLYVCRRLQQLNVDLVPGTYGILEPNSNCAIVPVQELEVAVVPGLAFDHAGGRLGRGGGFYDRLLAGFHGVACGVAYKEQIHEVLPLETHDLKMGVVLTPDRTWSERSST